MPRLILGAAAALALLPVTALALTSTPNDPFYTAGYQWALHGNASSTNAPAAWCAATGAGITIADIDTGADFGHPDLQGRLVVGAAFTSGTANPGPNPTPDSTSQQSVMDDYGHGTMTTGIMVAATNNGYGMAAEAPDAKALIVKVFSNKGGTDGYSAYSSDVAAGIYWAVEHGARVINLSLGPTFATPYLNLLGDPIPGAVQWAAGQNVGVAIAAGNGFADSGVTPPGQPANYPQLDPYALVVGAMGPSGTRASYSQSGSGVNIFAPGGDGGGGNPSSDILSTYPTYTPSNPGLPGNVQDNNGHPLPFALYDGTSFATPYAAGTLALLMSRGMSAAQARSRILGTARNVGGFNVVDAAAAVGGCSTSGGGGGGVVSGGGGAGGTAPVAGSTASAAPGAAASPAAHPTPPASASPASAVPDSAAQSSRGAAGGATATVTRPGGPTVVIAAIIAGVLCIAGAAGWLFRFRS